MIQRIQSLYLFIVSLFYLLYWVFGFDFYKKGYRIIENNLGDFSAIFLSMEVTYWIASFLPILISIICFIALFLFKKRLIQIRLSKIALYISIVVSCYTVFYFFHTFNYLVEIVPSKSIELLLYVVILNPFFSTYLIFIAIKSIKKDEKLVRGEGLIR